MSEPIIIYSDGASRDNPGDAAAGAVIFQRDTMLAEIREPLGIQTNNYAEYEAVVLALVKAHELGLAEHAIEIRMDSKLVVEQLSGNWKIKNEGLKQQHAKVQEVLANGFADVSFVHVRREDNTYADRLANEALDGVY